MKVHLSVVVQGIRIDVEHDEGHAAVSALMDTVQNLLAALPKKHASEEPLPPSADSDPAPAAPTPTSNSSMELDTFLASVRTIMEEKGIELPTLRAQLTKYGVNRLAEVIADQRAQFISDLS